MSDRPLSQCRHPWIWMQITARGKVSPCCHSKVEIGDVTGQSLDEIWNSPIYERLRGSIRDGYVDPVCRNASCGFVRETERLFGPRAYDFRIKLDQVYRQEASRFCFLGWHFEEPWGIWSAVNASTLYLDIAERSAPIKLDVLCRAAGNADHPPDDVHVFVNNVELGLWTFTHPDGTQASVWQTIHIPVHLLTAPPLEVRFEMDRLFPAHLANPADTRLLGLALSGIKAAPIPPRF